jgi:peptidoglycan/LPS O-acetylase OafA/YrhL
MATASPATRDREAGFDIADPGKEWRRGHQIPVVAAFDGYRGWAVLGVVLFHVFQLSGAFNAMGDSALGVLAWGILPRSIQGLFIVSGFVIFLPTVARSGDFGRLSNFAIRRAARLFPAYYLVLGICIVLLAVVSGSPGLPDAGTIGAHLAVLQTPATLVSDNFRLGFGVVPPVWTLSVEVGFYVLLPFVAVQYFRHPFAGLITAAAIFIAWRALADNSSDVAHVFGTNLSQDAHQRILTFYASQFPSWVFAICTGMTGAWAYVRLRDTIEPARLRRLALRVAVLALVVFAGLVYLEGHTAVTSSARFEGLFADESILLLLASPFVLGILMIAITLLADRHQRPVTTPAIRWVGDVSYGIYLIHFAVLWVVLHELSFPNDGGLGATLAWCAIVYPASIAYAYLSARFLERPIRRWAHRYGRRAQPRRPAEATAVGS